MTPSYPGFPSPLTVVPYLETLQTQFYEMHASALENVTEKEARPTTDSQHRGGSHVAARWAHEKPSIAPRFPAGSGSHSQPQDRTSGRRVSTPIPIPIPLVMRPDNEVASPLESEFAAGLAGGRRCRLLLLLVIICVGSRIAFAVHGLGSKTRAANLRLYIPLPLRVPHPPAAHAHAFEPRAPAPSPVLSCPRPRLDEMGWDDGICRRALKVSYSCTPSHSHSHSCALRSAPPGLGMDWMDAPAAGQRRSLHAAPPPPPLSPIFHHHPLPSHFGPSASPLTPMEDDDHEQCATSP
ncbi:hypothetical protein B0H14DRAFT_2606274 [Mycena olivaceomarginata]|nr:hypothetical protein B0H14DRAFT_2606274 [Mycena olivaceomarginata]